jgi:predicted nucleic acid-binding protein
LIVPMFTVDSSCMVAAICAWHEHHLAAAAEIERRLERGEHLAVSAPALVESYAVLTRLPAPHRLSPADACTLLEANFVEHRRVIALTGAAYVAIVRALAKQGAGGGRTYDAVIAECARQIKPATLLTFDRRHFDPPPEGVSIVEPSASD